MSQPLRRRRLRYCVPCPPESEQKSAIAKYPCEISGVAPGLIDKRPWELDHKAQDLSNANETNKTSRRATGLDGAVVTQHHAGHIVSLPAHRSRSSSKRCAKANHREPRDGGTAHRNVKEFEDNPCCSHSLSHAAKAWPICGSPALAKRNARRERSKTQLLLLGARVARQQGQLVQALLQFAQLPPCDRAADLRRPAPIETDVSTNPASV